MKKINFLLLAFLLEGGLALLAIVLVRFLEMPPLEQKLDWGWHAIGIGTACSLILFFFFVLFCNMRFAFARNIQKQLQNSIGTLFNGISFPGILFIAILAGCGEELFFRFFLQTAILQSSELWLALLLSNIIFGIAHWITPTYALLAGILGALFGYLFHYYNNLVIPILAHTLYDLWALWYFINYRIPKEKS